MFFFCSFILIHRLFWCVLWIGNRFWQLDLYTSPPSDDCEAIFIKWSKRNLRLINKFNFKNISFLSIFLNSQYLKRKVRLLSYFHTTLEARDPTPGIWLLGGWLAEWLTRARVCSVYVQLCGWQAGWLACSFESACVRTTLQMSFY